MSTYPKVESFFLVQINYRSPGNMKTDICILWGQFRVCYLWEQPSLWFLVSFVPACGWKLCNVVFVCGRVGVACTWLQMERNMVSCIVRTTVLRENSEVVMCYSVGKSELASVLSVFLSVQMQ